MKDIGIEVKLTAANDAKMNDYWGSGNFDAYIWYWSGDPDPNYQLSVFTSGQCGGWSDGCWKDPRYDALYAEAAGRSWIAQKRLDVVQEAQRYLYDHIPGIVLAYPGWLQAYRNDRFTGWVPAPGAHGYLLPGYNYDSLVSSAPGRGGECGRLLAGVARLAVGRAGRGGHRGGRGAVPTTSRGRRGSVSPTARSA